MDAWQVLFEKAPCGCYELSWTAAEGLITSWQLQVSQPSTTSLFPTPERGFAVIAHSLQTPSIASDARNSSHIHVAYLSSCVLDSPNLSLNRSLTRSQVIAPLKLPRLGSNTSPNYSAIVAYHLPWHFLVYTGPSTTTFPKARVN